MIDLVWAHRIVYSHKPEPSQGSSGRIIYSKPLWIVVIVAILAIGFLAYPRGTEPIDTNPNTTPSPTPNPTPNPTPTPTGDTVVDVDGNVARAEDASLLCSGNRVAHGTLEPIRN